MVRKIAKGIGYLILLLLAAIALFAAFNSTLVSNIAKVGGAKITEVEKYQPAQIVKGCSGPALVSDAAGLPGATFEQMKAYSDQHGGVGLAVLRDGKLAAESYRAGANAATRASSQSMHKTVVAIMIGAAIGDGLIGSVDDPVGRYIDEWKDDPRGKITLRQLLSMASGLHNPSFSKMEMAAMNMMLADVSSAALGLKIEGKAGTFNYNNGNFQIAGLALSRALKKAERGDYAAYLSEKLWCPLGNADASLWLERAGGEPRYYAYLDASVQDWARVGQLIAQQGKWGDKQLLPADWISKMAEPSPGNANYGLGIWRGTPWVKQRGYSKEVAMTVPQKEAMLADDVLFLDGFGGQRVYIIPSAKLVLSRSGETDMAWDDSVLVNIALRGLQSPAPAGQ